MRYYLSKTRAFFALDAPRPIKLMVGVLSLLSLAIPFLMTMVGAWEPLNGNDDFWAHATTGRWILAHGQVPQQMLFLWTDATPWVAHSWATEILFALFMRWGGETGGPVLALVWTALMGVAVWGLMLREWLGRVGFTFLVPLFGSMAIYASLTRLQPRPEMVSLLCLSVLLVVLGRWSLEDSSVAPPYCWWRLGAMALLFAVWANFHGLVFVGLAFLGLFCVGEIAQRLASGYTGRPVWNCLLLLVGAGLGTLLNPYGWKIWTLLAFLRPNEASKALPLSEFQSPFASPSWDTNYIIAACVVVVVALLAWAIQPRRRVSHLLWLILGVALFVSARRHVAICALSALSVLAFNGLNGATLWKILCEGRGWETAISWRLRTVARLVGALGCLIWLPMAMEGRWGQRATSENLPVALTEFMLRAPLVGQGFNDYGNSSYYAWRLAERTPLFIHLLNVSPTLPTQYVALISQTPSVQDDFDASSIGWVVMGPPRRTEHDTWPPLATRLAFHPRKWALIFACPQGVLWVRRTPQNAEWCHKNEARVPPEAFLPRFAPDDPRAQKPLRSMMPPGIVPNDVILPDESSAPRRF